MSALRALKRSDKLAFGLGIVFAASGIASAGSGRIGGLFLVGLGLAASVPLYRKGRRLSHPQSDSMTPGRQEIRRPEESDFTARKDASLSNGEQFGAGSAPETERDEVIGVRQLGRRTREEIALLRRHTRWEWTRIGGFLLLCLLFITFLVILAVRGDWGIIAIALGLPTAIAIYEKLNAPRAR